MALFQNCITFQSPRSRIVRNYDDSEGISVVTNFISNSNASANFLGRSDSERQTYLLGSIHTRKNPKKRVNYDKNIQIIGNVLWKHTEHLDSCKKRTFYQTWKLTRLRPSNDTFFINFDGRAARYKGRALIFKLCELQNITYQTNDFTEKCTCFSKKLKNV